MVWGLLLWWVHAYIHKCTQSGSRDSFPSSSGPSTISGWILYSFTLFFYSDSFSCNFYIYSMNEMEKHFSWILIPIRTLFIFSPADDGPYQREPPPLSHCSSSTSTAVLEDRRKSHVPEEFAGLLHGSSPACETLETPFHLYSPKPHSYASTDPQSGLLQAPEFSIVIGGGPRHPFSRTGAESNLGQTEKPQVVYRTIFHTQVNQDQAQSRHREQVDPACSWSILGRPPSSYSGQNGEVPELQGVQAGGVTKGSTSGAGYEERACTLGRMRSMPRSVLDLQLSKSLSKSDSNLVAVSPIQVSLLLSPLKWNHEGNFHLAVSVLPNWAKMFPAVQHFKNENE